MKGKLDDEALVPIIVVIVCWATHNPAASTLTYPSEPSKKRSDVHQRSSFMGTVLSCTKRSIEAIGTRIVLPYRT